MKQILIVCLLLFATQAAAQDIRPSAYLGAPGKVTVRGGKVQGSTGGVTTIAEQTINPANSATTSIYIDLSSTPAVTTSTSGFPSSSYFPICVVIKDANGVITSFTDSRPDFFMAGGSSSSSGVSSAFTFSVSGGTVTSTPNAAGLTGSSGTDAAVVINAAIAQLSTVGGRLFFRNGVYNFNSMTLDGTSLCNSFESSGAALAYAVGFPATTIATSVQWLLEGEATTVWNGEANGLTVNNSGVVFLITPTAVSSVAAGSVLAGFWNRPVTNCNIGASNGSNDVHYKNMTVRFPVNTRGNELAIGAYFALNVEYENVVTDFNVPYNTLRAGSAPTVGTWGSFGMTTTASISGNYQYFKNTFVSGYNIGYDFQSEHIVSETSTAIYCNFPAEFGRSGGAVNYDSIIMQFDDQENANGFIFGPQMTTNSRVDFPGLQIELLLNADWYSVARGCNGKMTESNPGITSGLIFYVSSCGIPLGLSPNELFSSGGQSFQAFSGAVPHFLAQVPGSDNFTRANSTNLGSGWTGCFGCGQGISIASNTAQGNGSGLDFFTALAANNDQFSKATVVTVDASGVSVTARAPTPRTALTYYDYFCSGTTRLLRKRITGTFTTLATAASGGCAVGDTIEIDVIGTNLLGYLTHSNVKYLDIIATDSSITTGFPGISAGATTDSLSTWFGGSLPPSRISTASLFTPDSSYGVPLKQLVVTADYTNATTSFSNLVGVGNAGQGLGFPVAPNTSYTMHCAITWSASAVTAGPQFQITGPASPTNVSINMMSAITATTTASAAAVAFSSALNPVGATVTSGVNETAFVDMGLVNGANAGTIQLQAAAQGAGTLTIRQGSSCTLQ